MRSLNESKHVVTPPAHFDPNNKPKGVLRVFKALKNSFRAVSWLAKNEAAFKQEVGLAAVAFVILAFWSIPFLERAILMSSIFFILFAEIINTAIEVTVDRIGTEFHALSGLAKDLASAGVFLSIVIACVLWAGVFYSHI
ncbi:diacylglycerol kinase [Alteromonas sp. KUL156]|nr:diacylglycerol kinase [Tenacibaculum sp. KUL118]GFD92587.1 diacylglycerol kinase [Alteromonas sp. KUL154]GFD99071.1 diacylglycerol kinase [Alteromonas sp. KUL156]